MAKEIRNPDFSSSICRSDATDMPRSPNTKPKRTEIRLVQLILAVVFVFALTDIAEDIKLHSSLSHLVTDTTLTIVAIALLFVLLCKTKFAHWRTTNLYSAFFETKEEAEKSEKKAEHLKQQAEQSKRQADEARKLAEQSIVQVAQAMLFAEKSKELAEKSKIQAEQSLGDKRLILGGLGQIIDAQLEAWRLSPAEKEIALLLLKGLSHADIAVIRKTSERTVRQQSLKIYSKAGLKGRTDLAAFFLEDLLTPLQPQTPTQSRNPDV